MRTADDTVCGVSGLPALHMRVETRCTVGDVATGTRGDANNWFCGDKSACQLQ
jgi:hypothetical protein